MFPCLFILYFSEGFSEAFRVDQTLFLLNPKDVFPLSSVGAVGQGLVMLESPWQLTVQVEQMLWAQRTACFMAEAWKTVEETGMTGCLV